MNDDFIINCDFYDASLYELDTVNTLLNAKAQ